MNAQIAFRTRCRPRSMICVAALALVIVGCDRGPLTTSGDEVGRSNQLAPIHTSAAISRIPGEYIVAFVDGASQADVVADQLSRTHAFVPRHVYRGVIRGFAARLSQNQVDLLRRDPRVAFIEEDQSLSPTQGSGTQTPAGNWGLDRADQRALPLDGSFTFDGDGTGVTAYVLDTGIETTHPEFQGRAQQIGWSSQFPAQQPCYFHGTGVAAMLGGGTVGVARNVQLRSIRITNDCTVPIGASTSDVIAGLDWVRLHRVSPSVANLSFGCAGCVSQALDNAVTALASSGMFISVSAGNENVPANTRSPSRASGGFVVGATSINDTRASFSNYGYAVELYAPGDDIVTAVLQGSYDVVDGTSFAAPMAAGAAALYLQTRPSAPYFDIWLYLLRQATTGVPTNATPTILLHTRLIFTAWITGPTQTMGGETLTFTSRVEFGSPAFAYTWTRDGVVVCNTQNCAVAFGESNPGNSSVVQLTAVDALGRSSTTTQYILYLCPNGEPSC